MTSSLFLAFPAQINPQAGRSGKPRFGLAPGVMLIQGLLTLTAGAVRAELPVPAGVLVAPGAGQVLAPVVTGQTMILRQQSDQATLDWKSFNIGPENTVRFEQPHSDSVALNRIHQADPSHILGSLSANGQLYLVNQNGFVFGQQARVDANALVVSSLDISQETLNRGLARRFSDGNQPALASTRPGVKPGDIVVEAGAVLTTREANGRLLLAAPTLIQQGELSAPDGQIILAASQDKVYLQQAAPDSDIRGLIVEVETGGKIENLGRILAERGNVSLLGFAVNQAGQVSASTSVRLKGSVRLLAREGFRTGADGRLLPGSTRRTTARDDGLGQVARVDLAPGSVTEVTLAEGAGEQAVDAQAQSPSYLEISGHHLHLARDARVVARSGQVYLTASDDPSNPALKGDARVYLEGGSRIDVSGVSEVTLPAARHVIPVELRSNELRDAPLQRNGVLHGETVAVDMRDVDANGRIPLADVSGALARLERSLAERSTAGGLLSIRSSGSLIARPGSVLDVSGGWVRYLSGWIETTQLLAGGQVFDIGQASPERHYESILSGAASRALARHEPGYVEGKAGGRLDLAAYSALLDGFLAGKTVTGPYQRTAATLTPASRLHIDLNQGTLQGHQAVILAATAADSPTRPAEGIPASTPLTLSAPALTASGFGEITLKTSDTLSLQADTRLQLPAYGTLSLAAAGFALDGAIRIPAGRVEANPITINVDGVPLPRSSGLVLGSKASLSVAGNWVNQQFPDGSVAAPDGGSIHLASEQQDLILPPGSRLEASGGAWLDGRGQVQGGRGGTISLVAQTTQPGLAAGHLILNGQLEAYGISQGGRLALASRAVWIGPLPDAPQAPADNPGSGDTPPILRLAPAFFRRGGFADYAVSANHDGLTVAAGVKLAPSQDNLRLPDDLPTRVSADRLPYSGLNRLPDDLRQPVHLALSVRQTAEQNRQSQLRVGESADITLEPQGHLRLASDTALALAGHLNAPAGEIEVRLDKPLVGDHGYFAEQSLWLQAGSRLSATGLFKPERNALGLVQGEVLPGGKITLEARRGYLLTDPDSRLDVSGSQQWLDFLADAGKTPGVVSRPIASAGGSMLLSAGDGIVAAGQLAARAGGPGVVGGDIGIVLNGAGRGKPTEPIPGGVFPDDATPGMARSLVLNAEVAAIQAALSGERKPGQVWISADRLNAAKPGSLTLKTDAINLEGEHTGSLAFSGPLHLQADRQIILDSPRFTWPSATPGEIHLEASHVALGSTQSRVDQMAGSVWQGSRLAAPAENGPGRFSVSAQGIDLVGGLSFTGFDQVALQSQGDVRAIGIRQARETRDYRGALYLAGDLLISARQFYPATLSDYTVDLGDSGQFTLQAAGTPPAPPLSAGGRLSLHADTLAQYGVLAAPFGQLRLEARSALQLYPGSLTTVSGQGLNIPLGRGSGDLIWRYPLENSGLINRLITSPPEKALHLAAPAIQLDSGAKIDLGGGGDLRAWEFIPGPGGSRDRLEATAPDAGYAVIPGFQSITTPYDPLEFPASGLTVGDSLYLSEGAGLPAGTYTLLPARYALLPGAWWIRPTTDHRDLTPGQFYRRLDGATVVAGQYRIGGTGLAAPRWQGFAVQQGQVARQYAEYRDYSANTFFSQQAAATGTLTPRLPRDAGRLTLAAGQTLRLQADIAALAAEGGRGGDMDISAERLVITGGGVPERAEKADGDAGRVILSAEELNRLAVASLVLGGVREASGSQLTVTARSVNLERDAALSGHELMLVARQGIRLASGTALLSRGRDSDETAQTLTLAHSGTGSNDGVLVRVSARPQMDVIRPGARGRQGILTVEPGASLAAEGSILLDASRDTRYQGRIELPEGSLALNARRITVGTAQPDTAGLVISPDQLAVDELRLTSPGGILFQTSTPLDTRNLWLDTPRLEGVGSIGVSLAADDLHWLNTGSPLPDALAEPVSAGSSLTLLARHTLELGAGPRDITGFEQTTFKAAQGILAGNAESAVDGSLTVSGSLHLESPRLAGYGGGSLRLAARHIGLSMPAAPLTTTPEPLAGLGVAWHLIAETIAGAVHVEAPAGRIDLQALEGTLQLETGSVLDVSARTRYWGDQAKTSPVGSIRLQASHGDILLDAGARLDLSGTTPDGELRLASPEGQFIWQGSIAATRHPDVTTPAFQADVAGWGDGMIWNSLAQAGFRDSVVIRQRQGSIVLPAEARLIARRPELIADQGEVDIEGRIEASGPKGGVVRLLGAAGVTLGPQAVIDAHATWPAAEGGRVTLDAVDPAAEGRLVGSLQLSATARIDVAGGAEGGGGRVHLRTGRDDETGRIHSSPLASFINGSAETVLEATRIYPGIARIERDTLATLAADTAAFMARAVLPDNPLNTPISLKPGLDIRNPADLQLTTGWDLMGADWRYAGAAGFLHLTAGGQIDIQASLTDGFATTALPDPLGMILPDMPVSLQFRDVMQPGDSWSYSLQAGGDIHLAPRFRTADPQAPGRTAWQQVMVRTGQGDIELKAGGDIRFLAEAKKLQAAAALYTAGRVAPYTWGDLMLGRIPGIQAPAATEDLAGYLARLDPVQMAGLLRNGYFNEYRTAWQFLAEYPTGGGDIHLTAGGDIQGIQTGQRVSDWRVRTGSRSNDPNDGGLMPTAFGLNLSGSTASETVESLDAAGNPFILNVKGQRYFNQNVGALGGGDVTVTAGGDISDLSVMIPVTGKPLGILTTPHYDGKPNLEPHAGLDTRWLVPDTRIGGGGALQLNAYGSLRGGEFLVERGSGLLAAGDSLLPGAHGLAVVVMPGEARFEVMARQDLHFGTALNPTLIPQREIPDQATGKTADFITYHDDSGLRVQSSGGTVRLQGDLSAWKTLKDYSLEEESGFNLSLYPGSLEVLALSGDLELEGSINLMPAPRGQLEWLAGRDIGTGSAGNKTLSINVSDADASLFPSLSRPETQLISTTPGTQSLNQLLDAGSPDAATLHAASPVHAGDTRPILMAAGRDVAVPDGSRLSIFLPKASQVRAGRDIRNVSFYGQNLAAGDATTLTVGRDLLFSTVLDANGTVASLDQRIQWGGPGQFSVQAGRDIRLGGSSGIVSVGNLTNPALPGGQGAAIDLWAGLATPPDYQRFLDTYRQNEPEAGPDDNRENTRRNQVVNRLFQVLKQAAAQAAQAPESARKALYQPGFTALDTLFPSPGGGGNLSLVFSQIKSFDGGGISLLVPAGQVDVGLAGQVGGVQKSASQLGIVVQGRGDLNAYTRGDFNVNQSRVFTLGGGDITLWSSTGSIDAGKGAKSALSAPPPVITVDEKGNIVTLFPPVVSGSGIQAITPSSPDARPGNVYLAAPAGVVNAGEAGISGGKVVIAASTVIGAANIQATGGTVGVPTAISPPVIPTGVSGAAAGAARAATTTTGPGENDGRRDEEARERGRKAMGSLLSSEVIGYGHCSVAEVRNGQPECG